MLRHIVSIGLAMTACAALIPTKVNAVTLSIRSVPRAIGNEIAAKPGDLIDFIFNLRLDATSESVTPQTLVSNYDTNELSQFTALRWLVPQGRPIAYNVGNIIVTNTDIATLTLKVEKPLKDRREDVWGTLTFDEAYKTVNNEIITLSGLKADAVGPDVVPVPEPLTIFGTAIGLGCGVLFKRKSSKKTVS
jgi:hypothetical protein